MNVSKKDLLLYAVTDRAWVGQKTLYQQVEEALKGGVTCLQLREKHLDDEAFLEEARLIGDLCRQYGVPFIINDRVDIALQCQADGVHVGQDDLEATQARQKIGPDKILGVSVHNLEEARRAQAAGADYLGVGAIYATATKPDASLVSPEALSEISAVVDLPLVAIGGLHKENVRTLKGTGVDGVALVSAIFGASDIEKACRDLRAEALKLVDDHD